MAELLGAVSSGITICGLFKACIKGFDLLQADRNHERDLRKLKLRLSIEKCRLYTWGQVMGLVDYEPGKARLIDQFAFRDLVAESLQTIIELFEDADVIKHRYGCAEWSNDDYLVEEVSQDDRWLSKSFSNFHISTRFGKKPSMLLKRARWVIHDGKKFEGFIADLTSLINGLKDTTSYIAANDKQEEMVERGVLKIKDVDVLEAISEACKSDHRSLSDAASDMAITISRASTAAIPIEAWNSSVEDAVDHEIADIESLTHTELKDRYYRLILDLRGQQISESQLNVQDSAGTGPCLEPEVGTFVKTWPSSSDPVGDLERSTSLETLRNLETPRKITGAISDTDLSSVQLSPSSISSVQVPSSKETPSALSEDRCETNSLQASWDALYEWFDQYNRTPPWYIMATIRAKSMRSFVEAKFVAEAELVTSRLKLTDKGPLQLSCWPRHLAFTELISVARSNFIVQRHRRSHGIYVFALRKLIRTGQDGFTGTSLLDDTGYRVSSFYIRYIILMRSAALSKIEGLFSIAFDKDPDQYHLVFLYREDR